MELKDFVSAFAAQFDDTSVELFTPSTKFRDLDEWSSITALSIISMIDEEFGVQIMGPEFRSASTIEECYHLIQSKK